MGYLIGYVIGGFVLAGMAVTIVALDKNASINLKGLVLIFLFWPFVIISIIASAIGFLRK